MTDNSSTAQQVSLSDFQLLIRRMYHEKDVARGVEGTFMWLMEEIGELATALRSGSHEERVGEFADVLAWLTVIPLPGYSGAIRTRAQEYHLPLPERR